MDQIKKTVEKLQNEVRRNKPRNGNYTLPKTPEFARFKMLIKFKASDKYPAGGFKIFYSLEELVKKENGYIDEWASLKKLMVFYNKLKKQNKLDFAKIFMSLEEIPLISDKKHNSLLAIITEYQEIFNPSLKYYNKNLDTKIKLNSFVPKWLE